MNLLDRITAGVGTRASGVAQPHQWLIDLWSGGEPTYSGKTVTEEGALGLIPVYSAVSLLAGGVGQLPMRTYERLDARRRRPAYGHRTWSMLHEHPNDLMAADAYWETVVAHVLLWGNHFSAKERGRDGLVNALIPLSPSKTQVGKDDKGQPFYVHDGKRYGADEMFHVRGLSVDGLVGLSPVQQARQALGNMSARDEFQGRFWANNARPGGVLRHPNNLSVKAKGRLERAWQQAQGGLANAGRTVLLEEGMEWQSLGMPLQDAQFIEQQKFSRSEVALLYRVPPYMLAADVGSSLTYSTSEGQSLDFVKWSLNRWLRRIEGALRADPDIFPQGTRFYPEYDTDALLRADSKARGDFYTRALDPVKGWMVRNEVREREGLNPVEGGDEFQEPPATPSPTDPPTDEEDDE